MYSKKYKITFYITVKVHTYTYIHYHVQLILMFFESYRKNDKLNIVNITLVNMYNKFL